MREAAWDHATIGHAGSVAGEADGVALALVREGKRDLVLHDLFDDDLKVGAAVAIASTGREALAVAADMRPTVVLSDLAMPDGDGFWLLDALRHAGANGHGGPSAMRVLAVTAHAGLADERLALEAGFDGYLCKPVDVRELADKIVRVTKHDG